MLLLVPALLAARAPREMVEIKAGDPIAFRTDRAYLLFRTLRPEGVHSFEPVFMRVPRPDEMARYEVARRQAFAAAEPELRRRRERRLAGNPQAADPPPSLETFNFVYGEIGNVQNIEAGRALIRGRPESVYLVEVVPGDYVLYGAGWEAGPGSLATCMCLGTVGFAAEPGVVTDLGYFLADIVHRVSSISELRDISGYGPTMSDPAMVIGAVVRPARADTPVPALLGGASIRPAAYRAIGTYFDARAGSINRLAPVPGVLSYDGRWVIDVASGRRVPDMNYR
jgi:hypothetical protein